MVKKGGFPMPPHIANAPILDEYLELPWRAFWDLRRGTVPTTPLRWHDAQEWCDVYEVRADQALGLHACIVELDTVYVSYHNELAEDERKHKEAEAKRDASISKRQR